MQSVPFCGKLKQYAGSELSRRSQVVAIFWLRETEAHVSPGLTV